MSTAPFPTNGQAPEGQIWPENDPPIVMRPALPASDKSPDEGVVEPVNDPTLVFGKTPA